MSRANRDLDVSLPPTAPNSARHYAMPTRHLNISVYTLENLENREDDPDIFSELMRELNPGLYAVSDCRPAPQKHDFTGHPLKDIYEHHLRVRDEAADARVHPLVFVVAQPHYQRSGLILVYLNTDERGGVGFGRCGVDMVSILASNLERDPSDQWLQFKFEEEMEFGENGRRDWEDSRYYSR